MCVSNVYTRSLNIILSIFIQFYLLFWAFIFFLIEFKRMKFEAVRVVDHTIVFS